MKNAIYIIALLLIATACSTSANKQDEQVKVKTKVGLWTIYQKENNPKPYAQWDGNRMLDNKNQFNVKTAVDVNDSDQSRFGHLDSTNHWVADTLVYHYPNGQAMRMEWYDADEKIDDGNESRNRYANVNINFVDSTITEATMDSTYMVNGNIIYNDEIKHVNYAYGAEYKRTRFHINAEFECNENSKLFSGNSYIKFGISGWNPILHRGMAFVFVKLEVGNANEVAYRLCRDS